MSDRKSKRNTRAVGQFSYYTDNGNRSVEVNGPAPPEGSTPWHVVIRGAGHIPISLLVYALTAQAAVDRVLFCMRWCVAKEDEELRAHPDKREGAEGPRRGKTWLEAYDKGEYWHEVYPVDTARIVAKVNWAGNGGVM